ncbi:hypothetical protein NADFUDRAFT_50354 [Nadsonia fulvescens var. elongata DSM 6958]|uniref:Ubiquitin-conjugating enzyme E2 1 n=1 Tax=Nadsonia fulvescens var. elongata DSM 6958 TaxID=857566 RepID=A0A1E3PML2_9ASCO|nr:hypothetical protein NADFUDRAFT_50354 [Nadsonia fulvescens var. elongata DSM 6958]
MSKVRRIVKELEEVKTDLASGITLNLINETDISHLKGTFQGPPGTPYEGGLFTIDIKIPNEYPFKPPVMKFDTRIFHPNISSQTGAICLDILKDAWSPILTLKSSLLSLQSLLQSPEPNDPQDAEVAKVYISDRDVFFSEAAKWTKLYAIKNEQPTDLVKLYNLDSAAVQSIVNMGFDQDKVAETMHTLGMSTISGTGGADENRLIERLLG